MHKETSTDTVYVVCVFKECHNSNAAKCLVLQVKQLKWSIFNKQLTSNVNIFNESRLLKWTFHTVCLSVCLFFQPSEDFCFPPHPREINKCYTVPCCRSVSQWEKSDIITKSQSLQYAFTMMQACHTLPWHCCKVYCERKVGVRGGGGGQRQGSKASPASWWFILVDQTLRRLKQGRWLVLGQPKLHSENLREKDRKEKQKKNRKNKTERAILLKFSLVFWMWHISFI